MNKSRNVNRYLSTCNLIVAGGQEGDILINQGNGLARWESAAGLGTSIVKLGLLGLGGTFAAGTQRLDFSRPGIDYW